MKMNIRKEAALVLTEVLYKKRSLSQVLPNHKKRCLNPQDAAFLQALCYGVLRYYLRLQWVIRSLLQSPLKLKDFDVLMLLYVGLYQLMELNTPPHAAISETVEAAKLLKKPWAAAGLVNAVLRNYLRKAPVLLEQVSLDWEASSLHPIWLLNSLKTAWPKELESIIQANNEQPPLILRVNQRQLSRDKYLSLLTEQGIEAIPILETRMGIVLKTPLDVSTLPGFKEGWFSVQDGSAQLSVEWMELSAGQRILDACAAPGGKTTHILESEPELGEVVAVDISGERTQQILENLKRLNLKARVITANALTPDKWWDGLQFDRILLDAPCSSTGVIRRHPDIKLLRESLDIQRLAEQQLALLKALWPLLKSNGLLLYATCSIIPQENQQVIEKFLSYQTYSVLSPFEAPWGQPLPVGHQLLPGQKGMDGFYYARIRKGQ